MRFRFPIVMVLAIGCGSFGSSDDAPVTPTADAGPSEEDAGRLEPDAMPPGVDASGEDAAVDGCTRIGNLIAGRADDASDNYSVSAGKLKVYSYSVDSSAPVVARCVRLYLKSVSSSAIVRVGLYSNALQGGPGDLRAVATFERPTKAWNVAPLDRPVSFDGAVPIWLAVLPTGGGIEIVDDDDDATCGSLPRMRQAEGITELPNPFPLAPETSERCRVQLNLTD